MASAAHCFYCFEVLHASFERHEPPNLQKVIDLFDHYKQNAGLAVDEIRDEHQLEDKDAESSAHVSDNEEDEEEDVESVDNVQEKESTAQATERARPKIPTISRLQASSASSRSSSTSSPSTFSASSSNSRLTGMTSTSSIGPRPSYASRLSVTETYPMFVTWNTISRSGHKSLRGCIGTFEALPLATGLATYALTSAFDDTRFSPIPSSLMSALSCSLTLLSDFEPCNDAMDWTLGLHGLRISFTHRNRKHGATYLPDVAVEQGWSKEETVESLMKKAGWDSGYGQGMARRLLRGSSKGTEQPLKPWEEASDFHAVRYMGLKASASYADWQEWHHWLDEQDLSTK